MGNHGQQRVALRGGIFRVATNVEVEAGTVLEEDVRGSTPTHHPSEEIAGHFIRTQPPLPTQNAGNPILILDAKDPALHLVTLVGSGPKARDKERYGTWHAPTGAACQNLVLGVCDESGDLFGRELPEGPSMAVAVEDRPFPAFNFVFKGPGRQTNRLLE